MRARLGQLSHDTFRSFENRNFRLFFGGQTVSQVGNWLTLVAQVLLVLHLTHNGFAVGLLTACQFLPVLFLGAWAGLVADRSDKRRLLLVVQTLAMAQSFTLGALAFQHHPPVWAFYLVALFGGFTVAFDNPARRAFVVEMVPDESVNNAVSLNSALMTGSRIVGPALAGLLATTVGFGWCFVLDGASYLAVLAGLYAIRTEELHPPVAVARGKGQVREGLRYVRTVPELFIPLVMMAILGTLAFNFQTVMPLFVTRDLHGSDATFTLLFSVISVGSLVGALAMARRTTVPVQHVIVSALGFGVAMVLLALMPNLGASFPAAVLVGFSSICFMTSSTAIVQVRSDPAMRGRVLALQSMVFLGSTPIGGPLLGAVCDAFGARSGLLLGGAACVVGAVLGTVMMRRRGGAGEPAITPRAA